MDGNQELELYELLAAFHDAAGGHDTAIPLTAMHGAGVVRLQSTTAGASLAATRSTRGKEARWDRIRRLKIARLMSLV